MVKLGNLSELSVGLVSISIVLVVMFMKIWEFLAKSWLEKSCYKPI